MLILGGGCADTNSSAITASQRSAGNNASVLGRAWPSSNTSIDLRHANSCEELISPRYETWHLHYAPIGHSLVLDNAKVAVLFAVLLA